ncbi:alpha/beta hydrolase [Thioalkalivibrio denitrificans]|uniref:Alpha/beta hydrolase n=1 Tax=Thioalkalivibrio denitrificans TaxID=108003 RepID=A0A1V3NLL2_9GAMM|nr:alpha/beta hydrolase [Thioalkalivibrio denitrificans]OOG25955.1 alpha/beta hydrolase [Thioalkalivibrio denitrificans]
MTVMKILLTVVGAYALLVGLVYVGQERLIYMPMRDLVMTPADHGFDYEDVDLVTEDDVRLHGWYVPAPEPRGVLLFFHGNAGNISHRMDSIRIFRDLGLSVFIIDYRGYGRSEGRPGEAGIRRDARAAWRHLRDEREVPSGDIVLFGRSLGAAVAADLATRKAPGAVILESAFTSAADLGAEVYPWLPVRTLLRHRHEVLGIMHEITAPVLIAHSRDDEIVSFEHARRLLEAAGGEAELLEMDGGHNDGFLRTGARYGREIREFLDRYL